MTNGGSPRPRRLWTRAIRRAVLAPELERYLARKNIDLLVTDQLEAVQVRVRKGLEVMEKKVKEGYRRAVGRLVLSVACLDIVILAGVSLDGPVARWIFLFLGGAALAALVASAHDFVLIQRARRRFPGDIEKARTSEELLQLSESALAEARALGMVPEVIATAEREPPTSPEGR